MNVLNQDVINEVKKDITQINNDLPEKQNKEWTLIGTSTKGSTANINFNDYNEAYIVIFVQVGDTQLMYTTNVLKISLAQERILRGAGGAQALVDTYQFRISMTKFKVDFAYVGGADYTNSSLAYIYAR